MKETERETIRRRVTRQWNVVDEIDVAQSLVRIRHFCQIIDVHMIDKGLDRRKNRSSDAGRRLACARAHHDVKVATRATLRLQTSVSVQLDVLDSLAGEKHRDALDDDAD